MLPTSLPPAPARARAMGTALIAVVLAALALALLPAPAAHAADRTVSGGRLDWGIKSSFLTYITGPVAQGSWELNGGAATAGTDQFRFHSAAGSYDPDTGAVTARYSGGVRFVGHATDSGEYELDLTVSNPALEISGTTGTLRADMRSKDRDTGAVSEHHQAALATLDLTGVDLTGGSQLSVSGIPATLTAEGAGAFAGFYQPGDPLDPVTFTADSHAPDSGDDGLTENGDDAEPADEDDEEQPETDEDAAGPAEITDAAVDWGIRRTYREFVSGDLTEGGWELADGAEDGGAMFRFPGGTGTLDAEAGTVQAEFTGSAHFTGNDLDLRLSGVTVEVADGTGVLTADITDAGDEAIEQPLVTFEVPEFDTEDGLLFIDEAPARLTEEGAEAFGLYAEGTDMDPVSLAVAIDEDVSLPPLPDLGSEPAAEEEPDTAPAADTAEDSTGSASSSSSPLPLIAAGVAVLAVLTAVGFLVLRRIRAQRTETPLPDKETSAP